jgi:predicted PolB exonuclease-like 3'-5' exonuclease
MLNNIDLKNVLVLDIETVPQFSSYDQLDEIWQKLWTKKMKHQVKWWNSPKKIYDRAGIYSEFGKIICISVGLFDFADNVYSFRLKSFYGDDEKELLIEFTELLDSKDYTLCGHNSKEFDFPYIARRCLINGIQIPKLLDSAGKKPWEVNHLDTMELWKFGDYKSFTSLNLLAAVFGINSPKDDIDGSQVWKVYWIDKDPERIKIYCQKDVVTVAQLLLKFKGMELLKEENVIFTN